MHESDPWEVVAEKIDDLETRVTEHFEDENEKGLKPAPIITQPAKPTEEEWARHQLIHTPFEPWCPHCMAARNARRGHPKHGRKGRIVPDTEG